MLQSCFHRNQENTVLIFFQFFCTSCFPLASSHKLQSFYSNNVVDKNYTCLFALTASCMSLIRSNCFCSRLQTTLDKCSRAKFQHVSIKIFISIFQLNCYTRLLSLTEITEFMFLVFSVTANMQ